MSLMEQFANPEMMHSLSMSEKLAGAGITTLMGMGITFIVLILLWGCIAIMTKFTYRPKKGDTAPQKADAAAAPSAAPAATATTVNAAADDSLIAVITAAIAAFQGGSNNFIVRKIRRMSGETTAWSDAGRADCIDSRKF
ncbi:OadG family protein [Anaerovorax odorimutans]|uniref:OadG family protein n=1 Tax=Anaerovorax odorimutans TaxID=109327 RepID=A0ABT1RLW5_9FIRM|nr:OadG family protein [Anaerovorax odorimutans]MCQ4636162.1 OadG family protein [Anaerovorax odorimutans]